MKWVLNIMLNRSYGANAPAFFIKNKISEVDEAMSIYENFISDEQLKSIAETREMKYKLDRNEWIAEGETNAKIEFVIDLVKKMSMTLEQAISFAKIDISYKPQIESKLKELGIKYND